MLIKTRQMQKWGQVKTFVSHTRLKTMARVKGKARKGKEGLQDGM